MAKKQKPMVWDPKNPEYWVNQKITLPPIDCTREEFDEECPDEVWAEINKEPCIVLITHVEVDTDGTAENAYYGFVTQSGYESNMNFNIYPIEMAYQFGYAGKEHFGEKIELDYHPHYK